MLVTAPVGHPPPLDLTGPCLVPAWPDPLAPGPLPVRIGWIPFPGTRGSGLFLALALALARVSAGRTGCPCLRSALGLPPRACPAVRRDVFATGVIRLCARFYPLDWGKRSPCVSPSPRGHRAVCPLPHPEFSGPAPCTEGRGPSQLLPSALVPFVIQFSQLTSPHPQIFQGTAEPYHLLPVSWKASGGLNF